MVTYYGQVSGLNQRSVILDLEDRLGTQHEAAVAPQVVALEVDLVGESLHVDHGEIWFFRLIPPDREQGVM